MKGNKINEAALNELEMAVKHAFDSEGTDKTLNQENKGWGHSYEHTYASQIMRLYARHLMCQPVRVAEVGVQKGNSMRALRHMLPFAEIYGFDKYRCSTYTAGAILIVGDAYSADTWSDVPTDFDLIIDDGSHVVADMLRGIPAFVDHLRPGGVLMIEDIPNAAGAGSVMDRLPGSELVDTRDRGRVEDDLTVMYMKPLVQAR